MYHFVTIFSPFYTVQKVIKNFQDITRNVEEKKILHEIFRVVSRFPRYILCYISENYIRDSDGDKLWLPNTFWS